MFILLRKLSPHSGTFCKPRLNFLVSFSLHQCHECHRDCSIKVIVLPRDGFFTRGSIFAQAPKFLTAFSGEVVECQRHFLALNYFTRKKLSKSWVPGTIVECNLKKLSSEKLLNNLCKITFSRQKSCKTFISIVLKHQNEWTFTCLEYNQIFKPPICYCISLSIKTLNVLTHISKYTYLPNCTKKLKLEFQTCAFIFLCYQWFARKESTFEIKTGWNKRINFSSFSN